MTERECAREMELEGAQHELVEAGKAGDPDPPRVLLIKSKNCLRFLRFEDIDWVRADGAYVRIRAGKSEFLVRKGIGEMEKRLGCDGFLRISRFAIVNLDRIEVLIPWFHGSYQVRLATGVEFKLTSRYARRLFGRVGKPL